MNQHPGTSTGRFARQFSHAPVVAAEHEARDALKITDQRLPFTICIVHNEDNLRKAVQIRHAAYARHLPEFAESLRLPETSDFDSGTVVLLAQSKLDGSPIGTARIETNQFRPLPMERSVALPPAFKGRYLAEVCRLGIDTGATGRLVKIAIIKACFQFCEKNGIEWAMLAARAPLDLQYEQLLFEDVFAEGGFVPLRHANNLPHRIMGFEIESGHARWTRVAHPLLKFFSYTRHPDIDISELPSSASMAHAPQADTPMNSTTICI